MEEISRVQVKIAKIVVKYSPIIIAIFYFLSAIFSSIKIGIEGIIPICYVSLIPFICLVVCSKLLKFCVGHRLPLYYSMLIDVINAIDFYIVIPIESKGMLLIYLMITGTFVLYGAYLKNRCNKTKSLN